ncbi:MAG TPA: hypothetical protein VMB26_17925 [Candidatus Binataceae bacterium]|nr:hypothetical protein [Candidatus Binataceae bacterium]
MELYRIEFEILADDINQPENDNRGSIELGIFEQILQKERHRATASVDECALHVMNQIKTSLDSLQKIVNATRTRARGAISP